VRKHFATWVISCLLLSPGCAAGTHTAHSKGKGNPFGEKGRIQWNKAGLSHSLRIDKAVADRLPTGLLRIRMIIRNKKSKDIFVDIRTLFTDKDGFELGKTNWEPIACTARTQTQYQVVSLSPNAHDYQIIIRDPKDFSWKP